MAEEERRASQRKRITINTLIRKQMPDGTCRVMEFLSHNLSQGGVFILAEDLSLFDLGEELEISVEIKGDKFYMGRAKVVRSARVFTPDKKENESGYGLMFLNPDDEFKAMLTRNLGGV